MKWFIPSWNGDLRIEPKSEGVTVLKVFEPTAVEQDVLARFGVRAMNEGWVKKWREDWGKETEVELEAPFAAAGAALAKLSRPGDAVLTGIAFEGGKVVETWEGDEPQLAEKVADAEKKGAKAAATVKRPTPCCPRCVPGAVEPASEVLLSFLDAGEHAQWAQFRAIVVRGGLSGHRYLISHRHGMFARALGRICFDLDLAAVVHFHDWTVPPEEEVLAAKLILEHREPWLRNEATLFDKFGKKGASIFKNPFGSVTDGVLDAKITEGFGMGFAASAGLEIPVGHVEIRVPGELAP